MPINTAMELFRVKLLPSLMYGLEIIWEYLSCRQLQELENMKPRYLKRMLGVSKFALLRYGYVLARKTFLVEDLRLRMLLPSTPSCEELLRELRMKRDSISESFYNNDAMKFTLKQYLYSDITLSTSQDITGANLKYDTVSLTIISESPSFTTMKNNRSWIYKDIRNGMQNYPSDMFDSGCNLVQRHNPSVDLRSWSSDTQGPSSFLTTFAK
ncbi:hypothetical protein ANN_21177 [Periplaneta americana]|uniref:Uncharacterized protein n=1 Tax=Periplaneta americana TaxID=6978 RepID=A0ABQ8SEM4_PERAM|nr:hypothetical protein ANN_21177 [Periplaneta americana]